MTFSLYARALFVGRRIPTTGTFFLTILLSTLVSAGALPDRLNAQTLSGSLTAQIDSLFAGFNQGDSPGCALAIYRNGEVVYSKGYGIADLEHNVPITPETRFDIGSTSKQFTAACLVLLEQQGKLSLDDDVRKHIPELPDYGRVITIRHMLNHTSGLRDYLGLMLMGGTHIDDVTTVEDALRTIVRQNGLDFETGTAHEYSNTGYFLASVIVERVSGRTLREFAGEHLFGPLGMKSTTYLDDHTAVLPNRAIGYSPDENGTYHRNVSYWEQNGDGGVFTTVEDLQLWDENFYRPNVGGTGLTGALLQRGVLNNGTTIDYALGLYYDSLPGMEMVLHGGSWGGYRAELIRIPSEHLSVAVLANSDIINPTGLATKVIKIILADRFPKTAANANKTEDPVPAKRTPVEFDPTLFDAYIGDYALDVMPDFVLSFDRDGDHYYSQATGQGVLEIFPSSDSTFFVAEIDASITFRRDPDGTVSQMTLHQGGDYSAHRVKTLTLTADELNAYVGYYHSSEIGIGYTLVIEDGTLVAKHDQFDPIILTPFAKDAFEGNQWNLDDVRFERGADGRVKAMLVSAGRVKDLRFVRE